MSQDLARRMRALYVGETAETWARIGRETPATYWEENAVLGRRDTYASLAARLQPLEGRRILDAGCGLGLLARRLARAGAHVTAVDVLSHAVLEARQRAGDRGPSFVVADFEDLLHVRGAFDDIVLQEVLEDYTDAERLRAIRRLGASGAQRIHLIFRQPGRWKGLVEPLLPAALVPTLDPVQLLRSIHLHTPYRLSDQDTIRRRSYNVRRVEFTLQGRSSGGNEY
ncbi:MAG TPA: methyltransferase domain-containing protein [Longimicrobiales bacterium]|nr:methyltransferase domain-containing protein [Longimicrobiales bacterium]